ncbi:CBS domain-containing protein [Candidatus Micrarchaeota archaeon]|nr:CBS domain-containing protein [Candidatus Micrarchaeota archaeon]
MLPSIQEIKARRKKLGLTQSQLASEAGVSQSLIAKIEAGTLDASYSNAVRIFEAIERLEHKITPLASQIMHAGVQHVKTTDSVGKALKLMKSQDFSQVPVYEGSHPVGSLSDKTVLDKISEGMGMAELSALKVADVMGDGFPVVDEKTPLPAVSSLLNYHFAVLVRKKDKIDGIITKADLMKLVGR